MKGDYSRLTFDPKKHYSSVRMQQGRLQIDADWNEQFDLTERRIATEITDLIGSSGGPKDEAGFQINVSADKDAPLTIGRGRYYVAGMLFENEAEVSFTGQPDLPGASLPADPGLYLAYLDVWQRHITLLEDPNIAEPALGGADTATRLKNIWQVKLYLLGKPGAKLDPNPYRPPWQPNWELPLGSGKMSAQVSTVGMVQENQLYRVEIHTGGKAAETTIKWSRDNGSVAARVSKIAGNTMTMSSNGPGMQTAFALNQWVELTNEERTLQGKPGLLVELAAVQGNDLTVLAWPDEVKDKDLWNEPWPGDVFRPQQIIVRRWDDPQGLVKISQNEPILLDNIQVNFETGKEAVYKSGDYWLIPARQLKGDIEWPRDDTGRAIFQSPHGIRHNYCGLALLELSKQGQWAVREDLRTIFQPLATGLVSKAGDIMTGPLTIRDALEVTGDIRLGGNLRAQGNDQPVRIDNALSISGLLLELSGSAVDSPPGDNPYIAVNGQRVDMQPARGLNTVILSSTGVVKGKANHDIYGSGGAWDQWADWVNKNSADSDIVAVVTKDALSGPLVAAAQQLLDVIGATSIRQLTFGAGGGISVARRPYALVFVRGSGKALENLQAYGGPNARIETTYRALQSAEPGLRVAEDAYVGGSLRVGRVMNGGSLKLDGDADIGGTLRAKKLASGSVGTDEIANQSVSLLKLKSSHVITGTITLPAQGVADVILKEVTTRDLNSVEANVLFLITAFSTTWGSDFTWRQQSDTSSSDRGQSYIIRHRVVFESRWSQPINVKYVIYEIAST